jgi:hypothetical protein
MQAALRMMNLSLFSFQGTDNTNPEQAAGALAMPKFRPGMHH